MSDGSEVRRRGGSLGLLQLAFKRRGHGDRLEEVGGIEVVLAGFIDDPDEAQPIPFTSLRARQILRTSSEALGFATQTAHFMATS
jgi:hypothetical protein